MRRLNNKHINSSHIFLNLNPNFTVGADGKLTVEYSGQNAATGMSFLVVYPKEKAAEGAAYMKALDAIRKEVFDARMNLGLPVADGTAPEPTTPEKARGFIAFARGAELLEHRRDLFRRSIYLGAGVIDPGVHRIDPGLFHSGLKSAE